MILILSPIPIPILELSASSTSDENEKAKDQNYPDHEGIMHPLLMHAGNPEINPPLAST
jgi:hypothetical protein